MANFWIVASVEDINVVKFLTSPSCSANVLRAFLFDDNNEMASTAFFTTSASSSTKYEVNPVRQPFSFVINNDCQDLMLILIIVVQFDSY